MRQLSESPLDEVLDESLPEKVGVSTFVRTVAAERAATAGAARDWLTPVVLCVAFGCLGLAIGLLAGLSIAQGISQNLLTSLFTFVGGVLLTYAGFARFDRGEMRLDPRRVALGVAGLSIGLCAGMPAGIYTRCNVDVQSWFLGERVAHSQCAAPSETVASAATSASAPAAAKGFGLQARHAPPPCQEALKTLNLAALGGESTAAEIPERLSALIDACGLRAP